MLTEKSLNRLILAGKSLLAMDILLSKIASLNLLYGTTSKLKLKVLVARELENKPPYTINFCKSLSLFCFLLFFNELSKFFLVKGRLPVAH